MKNCEPLVSLPALACMGCSEHADRPLGHASIAYHGEEERLVMVYRERLVGKLFTVDGLSTGT